jgi:DNA-binding MarR family transcriptional regulator
MSYVADENPGEGDTALYLEMPRMLERLHRDFMDILQVQLQKCGIDDLLPVHVFMLLDIDGDGVSLTQLIARGRYQRSNAFNHIRKLTEHGYVEQSRSSHDRRAIRLTLTPKAIELRALLRENLRVLDAHFHPTDADRSDARDFLEAMGRLERRWGSYLRYDIR